MKQKHYFREIKVSADAGSFKVNGCNFSNGYGDGDFKVTIVKSNYNTIPHLSETTFGYDKLTIYNYDCDSEVAFETSCFLFYVYVNKNSFEITIPLNFLNKLLDRYYIHKQSTEKIVSFVNKLRDLYNIADEFFSENKDKL